MNSVIGDDCFDHNEMLSLLDEAIVETHKVNLLKFSKDKISVLNKKYSDEVLEHILIHNFDNSDLDYLVSSFKNVSELIQEIIIKKSLEDIGSVLSRGRALNPMLYGVLINSTEIDINNKAELLSAQILTLSKDDVQNSLALIELNDYCRLFDQKQVVVEDNAFNRRILEILETRGWGFTFNKESDGFIRVFGKTIKE